MTRPLLLLSALLLLAAPLHALEGRVVRGEKAPVAGVVVSIAGEGRSVRTGADGHFSIDPEPRYPARVVVTSADGTTRVIDLAGPPQAPIEILLGDVVAEMITVSSASTPHIEAPPGAATDTLSSDELATLAPVHVADAVLSIPGVAASDGGPSSVPSVRGLARGRTLLLLDDARVATERRAGSLSWFADDTRPGPSEVDREGWISLDVSFSRQLTGSLELRLNAANLTDETRYASSDEISALSPGRTLGITLAGRFSR